MARKFNAAKAAGLVTLYLWGFFAGVAAFAGLVHVLQTWFGPWVWLGLGPGITFFLFYLFLHGEDQ